MIQGIQNIQSVTNAHVAKVQNQTEGFGTQLLQAIENVNRQQKVADNESEKMINGENVDLFQVMIAAQKSSIMMNTTIEMRNKVVEAYQEIMRMNV